MSANERQEGGNHYQKVPGEQHWDRIIRLFGLPLARAYFIGNITAYVERYLQKDGIKDLKKARHYIDKLIEEEEKYQASVNPYTETLIKEECPRCRDTRAKYDPNYVSFSPEVLLSASIDSKYAGLKVCASCASIVLDSVKVNS